MTALQATDLAPIVRMIVSRHGPDVLDHRQRLFALLRDHAPGDFRAIRLLMSAIDSGAAERLRALDRSPSDAEIAAEIALMTDRYGADPGLARVAVTTWARVAAALAGRDLAGRDLAGRDLASGDLRRTEAGAAGAPLREAPSSGGREPSAGRPSMLLQLPSGVNVGRMPWFRRRTTIAAAILLAMLVIVCAVFLRTT